jgi:hypothetical protein
MGFCASSDKLSSMTKEQIISGIVGGLITSIAIPFFSYFVVRLLNKWLVCIFLDTPRDEADYRVYNIRVRNNSLVTLKNVIAYVSIDNSANDIIPNSERGNIQIFNGTMTVDNSYLSWSKNIANSNSSEIEINQGEVPDINLIRHHINKTHKGIEIASEQGFFGDNSTARTLLRPNKNYTINIKITGDNFWPKKRKFVFNPATGQLIKK